MTDRDDGLILAILTIVLALFVSPARALAASGPEWLDGHLSHGDSLAKRDFPDKEFLQFIEHSTSSTAELRARATHHSSDAVLHSRTKADSQRGGMQPQMVTSVPAANCQTNGVLAMTNLSISELSGMGTTVTFTIAGGGGDELFDIFSTTNLSGRSVAAAEWTWVDRGRSCMTYTMTNQSSAGSFYLLSVTNDTDHDGLSDAYETLVSKTLVTTNDSDGDLMPDGWEVANGFLPLQNDAADDFDGDDISNLAEYVAGSNPRDAWVIAWGNASAGQCHPPMKDQNFCAIAGGLTHTVALRTNGSVVVWGLGNVGQTNLPATATNIASIASSWQQIVALRSNGTVICWGNTRGLVPNDLTNATAIAVGAHHGIALRSNGTVAVWGDPKEPCATLPVGLSSVKMIAAGWQHNLALLSNGTVRVWGLPALDILKVPLGLTNVVAVAAGGHHTLALQADGNVVAWGAGQTNGGCFWDHGQCIVPAGLSNVVAVAAGGYSSMALRADGSVVSWGENGSAPDGLNGIIAFGVGDGHCLTVRAERQTPVILKQPVRQVILPGEEVRFDVVATAPASIRYQWQHYGTNLLRATNALLVVSNSTVSDLGPYRVLVANGAGTVGSAEVLCEAVSAPTILSQTQPTKWRLLAGENLPLAVTATTASAPNTPLSFLWSINGGALLGGNASYGINQAGIANEGTYTLTVSNAGGSTNLTWQVQVAAEGSPLWWGSTTTQAWETIWGVHDTIALAAGGRHSLILHENGGVSAVGDGGNGQTNLPPVLQSTATNFVGALMVAAGEAHGLALCRDGKIVAWGLNNSHQTNVPLNLSNIAAISAGGHQSLALRRDGTLVQWGETNAPIPEGLGGVRAIASGGNFHLALLTDARVVAWGRNDFGQTNVPAGLSNVVAIAAGARHALALRENGTIVAWGANGAGQINVPGDLTNVMAIAAGDGHSLASRNDGSLLAWGDNSAGQTSCPKLGKVKTIAAGGRQSLAAMFNPVTKYPVDVTQDLLLIFNESSPNSAVVKDYYLQRRPGVGSANVLGLSCTNEDVISAETFREQILQPIWNWLAEHPTKHPQYLMLFPDIPIRVWAAKPGGFDYPLHSVAYGISTNIPGIQPFVMFLNMGRTNATNDCIAYINKLVSFAEQHTPDGLLIGARGGGYQNVNYIVDDVRVGDGYVNDLTAPIPFSDAVSRATNGLLRNGIKPEQIVYTSGRDIITNGVPLDGPHIATATNVAGYICWGAHSALVGGYPLNGRVRWSGASAWWIIETTEAFNGWRDAKQGHFTQWFSPTAFGGTNYECVPVGAVTHCDEPGQGLSGVNDSAIYFGLWAAGKNFGISAWASQKTERFQPVGDPFVTR